MVRARKDPEAALKLERALLEIEKLKHARSGIRAAGARRKARSTDYDGAGQGRRTAGWSGSDSGPDGVLRDQRLLRRRARHLSRNNPWAIRAVTAIVANTVGTGIRARLSGGSAKSRERWTEWANSTAVDVDGRHNLYGLQALLMRTIVESGEALVVRRFPSTADVKRDGLVVPLQLQVFEPEILCADSRELKGGNKLVGGVEFDSKGRRVAYHMYKSYPSSRMWDGQTETVRVPAAQVCHVYRVDRPSQPGGTPWVAPVMARLFNLDDYADAALERARVAACFAAFVYDADGEKRKGNEDDDLTEHIEPGIIQRLGPGEDIRFATPPATSDYPEFVAENLRAVAAGYNIPYETLSGDLSRTSFASARIGWLEFDRILRMWREEMIIALFLRHVFGWWREAHAVAYGGTAPTAEWTPPKREMLNPREEIAASVSRIRSGLSSWGDEVRALGGDPAETLRELIEFANQFDEHQLVLDCDPRRTTQSGQAQGGPHATAPQPEPRPDDPPNDA